MVKLSPLRIGAQIVAYTLFAAVVGYFSVSPPYTHVDPEMAQIKLNLTHSGQRKGECRRLTPEEIAKLAPNMRRPMDCPRERVPVVVELIMDGTVLYKDSLIPSGVARDGKSSVSARFTVPPGRHELIARLRDSAREQGFDYERVAEIELASRQNFVVDFRVNMGGFIFM